ncbi:hypothetical protein D6D01_06540 [Aureobasidium pullulans]|uniref:Uncharacterized protein n=1 Tax=Aureobasidium pullulans TaxID=5580 RepID=A0A4S9KZE0_AURPU|nr:hypothetical protein D6D01_06540 [Aureobasidium pullulans]
MHRHDMAGKAKYFSCCFKIPQQIRKNSSTLPVQLSLCSPIRFTSSFSAIYVQQVPIVHVVGISSPKKTDSSDMNWTVLVLFVCLRPSVDCCEVRSSQLDLGTVDTTFTHKDHNYMIQQYEGSRYLVIGKSAVTIWLDSSFRNH